MWWPAGSQAIDPVVWQISALDLGWLLIPALGLCRGVGGVGSQLLIQLCAYPGSFCLCAQAAGPLIRAHAHLVFQVWAPGY